MDTTTPTPTPGDQPPVPPAGQPPYPAAGQPYPAAGQPYPPGQPYPAGQPYPPHTPPPERSGTDAFFGPIRRVGVVRSDERWIGGVAGGLALRFGIDPLLVRGIFGVTVLLGGAGFILYALAWALLPEQVDGRIHLEETIKGRFDVALLGAIGMFIVGATTDDWWYPWNSGRFGWLSALVWLAAIATVVGLVIAAANQRSANRSASAPGSFGGASGAPPYAPGGSPTPAGYGGTPAPPYAPGGSPAPAGYGGPPAGSYSGRPPQGPAGPPSRYSANPPAPVGPPKPPKPRVLGPGTAAVGSVVGLSLVTLAGLLIADRQGTLVAPVFLTAAAVTVILAGLGIMVAGLRGRRSGTLGFIAIVGVLLAVPAAAVEEGDWTLDGSSDFQFIAGDSTWAPQTPAQARQGLSIGVGEVNVDLTELDTDGEAVRVPVRVGAGQMTVTVPRDTPVSAEIRIGAGDITWDVEPFQQISGVSGGQTYDFDSDEVINDSQSAELVLELETGAGEIRVVEVDR